MNSDRKADHFLEILLKFPAQFFLESTKWDLTHALSQFFDSDSAAVSQSQSVSVSQPTTSSLSGPPASMGLGMGLGMPVPPSTSASSSASAVPKQRTNIASFKDLLSQGSGDEDSDDGPDLFSGGEKSSLAMKGGPGKKNKAPNDIVKNILEQAAKFVSSFFFCLHWEFLCLILMTPFSLSPFLTN